MTHSMHSTPPRAILRSGSVSRDARRHRRPAAAFQRGCASPHRGRSLPVARAETGATAADGRAADALEYLEHAYETADEKERRQKREKRDGATLERLGLLEEYEAATTSLKARDRTVKWVYGATRTEFGASAEIAASAEVVYGYLTTPAALKETFGPELRECDVTACGTRARCEWVYSFGDIGRRHGREAIDHIDAHVSVIKATEVEKGKVVKYEATTGMPVGATFTVTPKGQGACEIDVDAYIHLPLLLTREHGTLGVAMDVREKFALGLEGMIERVQAADAAARLAEAKSQAEANLALGERAAFYFAQ
jgi:uncharacterized protein YndB with AHSA1/START domain